MAAIRRIGDKYQVRFWRLDGRQQAIRRDTELEALRLKVEIETCQKGGRDWEPEPAVVRREPDLLEDAVKAYLESRSLRLRPATLRSYGDKLGLFLRFLKVRVRRGSPAPDVTILSRALLDEFLGWLLRPKNSLHGHGRSGESAGKVVRVVQLFWEWAEGSDRFFGVPRPRKIDVPPAERQPVVAPTWAEMDACIAACDNWHQRLLIWLRYSGLRVGESMLFEWRDVDMARGTLTIRPEINKTGAGRVVPLSPHLLDEIAGWGKREGYLIPSERTAAKRERQARTRDVCRAWEKAGVRPEVWKRRPDHAFRKGIKSGLLAMGANEMALDYLQCHTIGGGGSKSRYIDPSIALPLRETITLIPKIGSTTPANVHPLQREGAAPAACAQHVDNHAHGQSTTTGNHNGIS